MRSGVVRFETLPPYPSVASVRIMAAVAREFAFDSCHIDTEQTLTPSALRQDVQMPLPKGCGSMSGKVVKFVVACIVLYQKSR